MRSFPNAVTEAAREITAETIAALREETRVDGAPQRKNFAKQQLRFAMQAGDEHNKCRTTRCAATRRRKVMTRQQGEAVAHDDGGRMDEGDAFAKVAAKKKSCRERRSGFVLLESLPVIRAIRWAISFALVIDSACGLRLTNMTAPLVADTRSDMHMDCHFDMGAELLYAVKWYKDDQEFFRFQPHQQPHTIMYPVAGVHMQTSATQCDETRCKLRLTNLTREHSGGAYRCEVSTEAPAFRLASETHSVTVATLPLDLPRITGLVDTYAVDDMLTLECVSGAGDPTPQLTWYINNQPAPAEILGEASTTQVNEKSSRGDHNGIEHNVDGSTNQRSTIVLAKRTQPLRMRIERRHLQGAGAMMVQCASTLPAMPMVQPQTVGHTVIIRSRTAQVNNEKLHWPDYASSSSSSSAARFTFGAHARRSASRSYLTSYLSCRNFQILAINLLLLMYYHYDNN
ncbi:uncharacterized protein [Atheta coriaria]|uniref:uncharacterized protein n=1 Tax=Dalotia coriaria TaxID=877792 RepID=UPI0031F4191A